MTLILPLVAQDVSRPRVVGYFPQWGLYNETPYTVKELIASGGAHALDQIDYAQGFVTGGHCSIADPNADLNFAFSAQQSLTETADDQAAPFRGYLHQLAELKRRSPHLKLVISLEGRASDFAWDALPEHRSAFLDSCVDLFLRGQLAPGVTMPGLFDGIDVDWEYPEEPDAANYIALLTELRQRMNALRPGLVLSIAVGPSPRMYPGVDMAAIARTVDEIGLMSYDFHGPWDQETGFLAPLSLPETDRGGSVQRTVTAYLAAGVPAQKLLIGVPFYGYGWRLVPDTASGLYQEGEPIHGDRPYRYIQTLAGASTVYRDPASQTPWLFDGDAFWTYDDPLSVCAKATYAQSQHLGGVMLWELAEDTSGGDLVRAARRCVAP